MTTLVTLRPGLTLDSGAAASWARMESEAGRQLDVNRSYADPATQQKLYDEYRAYLNGGPWAPLALPPSQSWHCKGLAVDTDDHAWIIANPDYGWRFVVASEAWHAQYYPGLDKHIGEASSGGGSKPFTPTTEQSEEDDMGFYFRTGPQAVIYFWNESRGRAREVSKDEQSWRAAAASTAGGAAQKIVTVSKMWQDKALALGTYAAG